MKDSFRNTKQEGQVLILTVLALGGALLGATAIAGLLTTYQIRQTTDLANSAKAIFAADAGIEWGLYNFFCSLNPAKSCPLSGAPVFTNGAVLDVKCTTSSGGSTNCFNAGPPPTAGLIAHWKLDDGNPSTIASDASGSGNTGTLVSGPQWQPASQCRIGQCLGFDGLDDFVTVDDSANQVIPSGNAAFSISLWFNANVLTPVTVESLMTNELYQNDGFRFGVETGQYFGPQYRLFFWSTETVPAGVPGIELRSNLDIVAGTWYHAVISYTGSSADMYIDGNLEVSDSSGAVLSNIRPLDIGRAIGGKQPFEGSIDDVRIYNRALSLAEAVSLYNAGNPAVTITGIKAIGTAGHSSRAFFLSL